MSAASMNKRTAKALEKSIEHHKQNLLAKTPDDVRLGCKACALCKLYRYIPGNPFCKGCPVAERADRALCYNTPYTELDNANDDWCNHWRETGKHGQYRRKFRAAEKKEIKFLEGLR